MSGVEFRDAKDRKRHWPQVSEMWLQLEQLPLPCTAFPFLWWWLSVAARAAPGSYNLKFLTIYIHLLPSCPRNPFGNEASNPNFHCC